MANTLRMTDTYPLLNENDVLVIVCANAVQLTKLLGVVVTGVAATSTWKAEQYLGIDMTGTPTITSGTATVLEGQVSPELMIPIGALLASPLTQPTYNLVTRLIVESGQVSVKIHSPATSLSTDNPVEFRTYIEQPASPPRIA